MHVELRRGVGWPGFPRPGARPPRAANQPQSPNELAANWAPAMVDTALVSAETTTVSTVRPRNCRLSPVVFKWCCHHLQETGPQLSTSWSRKRGPSPCQCHELQRYLQRRSVEPEFQPCEDTKPRFTSHAKVSSVSSDNDALSVTC